VAKQPGVVRRRKQSAKAGVAWQNDVKNNVGIEASSNGMKYGMAATRENSAYQRVARRGLAASAKAAWHGSGVAGAA